jgi:hypothetical protein
MAILRLYKVDPVTKLVLGQPLHEFRSVFAPTEFWFLLQRATGKICEFPYDRYLKELGFRDVELQRLVEQAQTLAQEI